MELDFVVIVVGIMYYLIGSFINKENAKFFLQDIILCQILKEKNLILMDI